MAFGLDSIDLVRHWLGRWASDDDVSRGRIYSPGARGGRCDDLIGIDCPSEGLGLLIVLFEEVFDCGWQARATAGKNCLSRMTFEPSSNS